VRADDHLGIDAMSRPRRRLEVLHDVSCLLRPQPVGRHGDLDRDENPEQHGNQTRRIEVPKPKRETRASSGIEHCRRAFHIGAAFCGRSVPGARYTTVTLA
jgi:hypothetical protein